MSRPNLEELKCFDKEFLSNSELVYFLEDEPPLLEYVKKFRQISL